MIVAQFDDQRPYKKFLFQLLAERLNRVYLAVKFSAGKKCFVADSEKYFFLFVEKCFLSQQKWHITYLFSVFLTASTNQLISEI